MQKTGTGSKGTDILILSVREMPGIALICIEVKLRFADLSGKGRQRAKHCVLNNGIAEHISVSEYL